MRPLDGLRVLQFGNGLAAEMVGLSLSDLGAEVIVCGSIQDNPLSAALERGKRIVELSAPSEAIRNLARSADVIIEPRFAPRSLQDIFAQTSIKLSLPAFPSGEQRFAGKSEDEGSVLAAAGVLAERGPSNRLRGLGPAAMPMPIASAYGAAFGTLGVLAAIYGRETSGQGDAIEVSLFSALMEGFSYNHVKINGMPARYADPRGAPPDADLPLQEAAVQALIDPLYRAFKCSDGAWFYVATAAHLGLVERTLRLFGIWDELVADGLPTDSPYLSTRDWKDKEQGSIFAYPQLAPHWRHRIRNAVAEAIAGQPASYWEATFAANGLCGTRVRSSSEWLSSEESTAAGLSISVQDPLAGLIKCPGPYSWVGQVSTPTPRAFADNQSISWQGPPWIVATPAEHMPKPFLSGLRVLDLCNVIAGPTVAGCLTRFGAEVIKVDATKPGFDPFITVILSLQSARGKESILLDLKSTEGRQVFERLAASADLVTFNGPQSQIDSLGIDFASLSKMNAKLVLTQISAFGGPQIGPLADRKGVDEVLQAATGVMHRLQHAGAPPEEYAHFGTIDVATGVWGSVASVAALVGARRKGTGGQAATSLAAGAAAVQMPFLWISEKLGAAPDPKEFDATTAIGNVQGEFHVSSDGRREALMRYSELRKRLALGPGSRSSDVGFELHEDHPTGLAVELVTQCAITCAHAPLVRLGHPHKYGQDTRRILSLHGYSDNEIDHLIAIGAVVEKWDNHEQFLPD